MTYQKIGLAENKIPAFAGMTNQRWNRKNLIKGGLAENKIPAFAGMTNPKVKLKDLFIFKVKHCHLYQFWESM